MYSKLKEGWIIEFRIIKEEQMQYMKTPVYRTKRELSQRLTELHEDKAVIRAEVYSTRYFDKTEE